MLRGLQLNVSCHFALCCSRASCFIMSLLEIDDPLLYRSSLVSVQEPLYLNEGRFSCRGVGT
jgi:hypothetical protein